MNFKQYRSVFSLGIFFICCLSCKNQTPETASASNNVDSLTEQNTVSVIQLKKQPFHSQIVSNGKLHAYQKSRIDFQVAGRIKEIYVKNGQVIQKGKHIAALEAVEYQQALDQARVNLDKAALELQDLLIGQGYTLNDTSNIPPDILQIARTRSGYAGAKLELNKAEYDLQNTVLKAPFTGIAANIEYKPHEQVNAGEEFCTLIDHSTFEVAFQLLETETGKIRVGQKITVVPHTNSDNRFNGAISGINPVVDENGMVEVKARIKGNRQFMEGMNVKVYVENAIKDQLVVPRSAVLLRDNHHVLFKYVNGQAYWTYVNILHENSESYAVKANPDRHASLEPGDTVIVGGNMYLAHESEVEILVNSEQWTVNREQ